MYFTLVHTVPGVRKSLATQLQVSVLQVLRRRYVQAIQLGNIRSFGAGYCGQIRILVWFNTWIQNLNNFQIFRFFCYFDWILRSKPVCSSVTIRSDPNPAFHIKKKYIQNVVQFRNYLLQTQHSLKRSIKLSHEKKIWNLCNLCHLGWVQYA